MAEPFIGISGEETIGATNAAIKKMRESTTRYRRPLGKIASVYRRQRSKIMATGGKVGGATVFTLTKRSRDYKKRIKAGELPVKHPGFVRIDGLGGGATGLQPVKSLKPGVSTGTLRDRVTKKKFQDQTMTKTTLTIGILALPHIIKFDEDFNILEATKDDRKQFMDEIDLYLLQERKKHGLAEGEFIRRTRGVNRRRISVPQER